MYGEMILTEWLDKDTEVRVSIDVGEPEDKFNVRVWSAGGEVDFIATPKDLNTLIKFLQTVRKVSKTNNLNDVV